jgi:MFS family permease
MFLGYGLIAAIPLLGFSLGLEIAILLVLLERLGKAFRSPSRDTVLSIVSKDVGAGKAFGIHELLDQIGGILGPLTVTFLMFSTGNYNLTFSLLALPFLVLIIALIYTYKKIGVKTFSVKQEKEEIGGKLPKAFFVYTFAVLLNTVGLLPYTIILFKASEILKTTESVWIVPLIYLLIQGVDAPVALAAGFAYDKFGSKILVIPFILSIFSSLLAMSSTNFSLIIAAAVVLGIVLGMQESVYRAAVSQFTSIASRGTAYGVFNTVYGVGFLLSGGLYGLMVDLKISFITTSFYASTMQIIAIVLLTISSRLKTVHS